MGSPDTADPKGREVWPRRQWRTRRHRREIGAILPLLAVADPSNFDCLLRAEECARLNRAGLTDPGYRPMVGGARRTDVRLCAYEISNARIPTDAWAR